MQTGMKESHKRRRKATDSAPNTISNGDRMADKTVVPDIRPDILDRDVFVWFGVFLVGEVIELISKSVFYK